MHFLLWQLADSAFPIGGFAHSSGLEAAWQQGQIRNRTELVSFLHATLEQLGRAALPFVNAGYAEPERFAELDALCNAFTSNHVANRASRAQGRAFRAALDNIFPPGFGIRQSSRLRGAPKRRFGAAAAGAFGQTMEERQRTAAVQDAVAQQEALLVLRQSAVEYGHFAPVFGAGMRRIEVPHDIAVKLFVFQHIRGVLAASVRLNIIGPMEAQLLQRRCEPVAEETATRFKGAGLEEIAQTAPLVELLQGAHDRLYSRLFQS